MATMTDVSGVGQIVRLKTSFALAKSRKRASALKTGERFVAHPITVPVASP
jgi:hypothetical protein